MTIQEQLVQDMKIAMKNKEAGKLSLSVIRMARAAIKNAEIDSSQPLNDADVIAILAKELKLRKDSLAEFEKTNREDLIAQTKQEMEVLKKYLPQPLTAEEIVALVRETIQHLPMEEQNLGTVMKVVMPSLKGLADGKAVRQAVQDVLNDR